MSQENTKRILLVDDEEAILLAFRRILGGPTVEIDTASTVEESVRLLTEWTYAAVVTDLRLSGAAIMDGYVVIREAKQSQPEAKVIVMTAYGGEGVRDTVFGLGVDMYLEKPVSPSKLKQELVAMGVYR